MDMDVTGRWRELPKVLWHEIRRDYRKDPAHSIFWYAWVTIMIYLVVQQL